MLKIEFEMELFKQQEFVMILGRYDARNCRQMSTDKKVNCISKHWEKKLN